MELITSIKAAIWLGLGIMLMVTAGYILNLEGQNRQLAVDLELARRQAEGLRLEMRLNHQALLARENEARRLAEEMAALNQELEKYYEQDCQARAWADALCPTGVLERLRR